MAKAIIIGTYDIPTDLDHATAMILKEIDTLGMKIVNRDKNEIIITPEDFRCFWKKVNEFTSLSMSGMHGHYKAVIQDLLSTEVLAMQLTVIARSGIPPESWSVGLQVMLEKIAGVCLMEKLCAIQLYEASIATTSSSSASRQCKCSQTADTSQKNSLARKEVWPRTQSSTRL